LQIVLKPASVVVRVSQDGKEPRLIKRAFNATQDGHAVGIGHIKNNDANRSSTLVAKGSRKQVGTIAKLLGCTFNALLGGLRYVTRQGSIVQDDGDSTRRKAALFGNFANSGYCRHSTWFHFLN